MLSVLDAASTILPLHLPCHMPSFASNAEPPSSSNDTGQAQTSCVVASSGISVLAFVSSISSIDTNLYFPFPQIGYYGILHSCNHLHHRLRTIFYTKINFYLFHYYLFLYISFCNTFQQHLAIQPTILHTISLSRVRL